MHRRDPLVREALLAAMTAALVAAPLAWLGPPGSDLAAHVYQRTLFLQHGFTLWNNFWYAGRYSFIGYSVLYYPLAALLGIRLLAVATISLAALAFAVVLGREWGPTSRWSSRTFAVVWGGIVLSAAFPFALGIALALLAIWAFQSRRRWEFAALTALTLAASPVAFLLLVVVLAGIALARRASLPANVVPLVAVLAAGAAEIVLWRLFPQGGRFPFSFAEAAAAVAFCVLGIALTWRVESARVLQFVFAVYLVAILAVYVVPSSIGENIARFRFAAIPLAVLVLSLRRRASSAVRRTRPRARRPGRSRSRISTRTSSRATGSRRWTRRPTGRRRTSRTRTSRSPAGGSGRTTSRSTPSCTASPARRRT